MGAAAQAPAPRWRASCAARVSACSFWWTSPHLRAKYPFSSSGATLESDKVERVLLPSAPCNASEEVAHILAVLLHCKELPESLLPQARLLTFFVGAKPRAVEAALSRDMGAARVVQLSLGTAVPAVLCAAGSVDCPGLPPSNMFIW